MGERLFLAFQWRYLVVGMNDRKGSVRIMVMVENTYQYNKGSKCRAERS